ncbi:MAG: transferase [Selenomonadaceae bacterium]|nr:transferase [Selenomonadaceae bacterium]
MKHLIIIGVGGFAREVYWHAQDSIGYGDEWNIKGFLDGDVKLAPEEYEKLSAPVLGDINTYDAVDDDVFVLAIADPSVKKKLIELAHRRWGGGEALFPNLIHKSAIIHGTVKMGVGNVLTPHVSLNDHVVIGKFNTFNCGSGIGHDGVVGDYCSFMGGSGVAGFGRVGNEVYFGTGALVLPHGKVDDEVYVGVKSVVFKHVRKGQKVFGNPAMPI